MYSPEPFRIYVNNFYSGNGYERWGDKQIVSIGTYGAAWAQTHEMHKMNPPCGVTCYELKLDIWSLDIIGKFIECLINGRVIFCFSEWWLNNPNA